MQQYELNALAMYRRLAKVVRAPKDRELFRLLAKDQKENAGIFHDYTKKTMRPQKLLAFVAPVLYYVLGRKLFYKLIVKGNHEVTADCENLASDFPQVKVVRNAKYRHISIVLGLL